VLLVAYLVLALTILAGPMWAMLTWSSFVGHQPEWLRDTDPFLVAFLPYLRPGAGALSEQAAFLGITLALSASLMILAVVRVRAVALRQAGRPARGSGKWKILSPWRAFTRCLPGPSLDGNPVLWREWWHRRPSRWARLAWLLYGLVATLVSLLAVYVVFGNNPWGPGVCAWVNALQVSIGLILVCVTAGTALAEERDQGSLDLLLATPLTTRAIVWGKWLGAYCTVPLLAGGAQT
jgi:hypothetical protein